MSAAHCILVDADACPVKNEIHTVAFRHAAAVRVVSNSFLSAFDAALVGLRRRRA